MFVAALLAIAVVTGCATRAPVFVLGGDKVRGRLQRFHASLRERDRVRPLDDTLDAWPVEPLRETQRVAAEVRTRLGLRR